ncbi:MAG TPA: DUF2203 domain-containing protein [Verrucomicrobiae bacterium]|nr:DUF2203 domain-containing protein [Verrucomicrobiae bacterium]
MSQRFTLAEAESLIPLLDRLLREAATMKAEYDEAEKILQDLKERVVLMGGVTINRNQALDARGRREVSGARLKHLLEQVQNTGCLVKDLGVGLVDFPTLYRGQEVYMCWKLGEAAIESWHGVDEGFRGRKPIDQDFRDHHRGDPEQ